MRNENRMTNRRDEETGWEEEEAFYFEQDVKLQQEKGEDG
jgi:hypothetical protein